MSKEPRYIHHVNFPTTDPERTKEWYAKVFGMRSITPKSIRHTRPIQRPENQSMFCYIHDPDHTMIELVHHHKRPVSA